MKEQRKTAKRRAENNSQIESVKTSSVDPRSQYAAGIFVDQLKKEIESSDSASGLKPLLSAMEECCDEANVNQQIANRRNVSVDRVVTDKKRLRRFGKALVRVVKRER
jgi:hypothetical protein